MPVITVLGKASGKSQDISYSEDDLKTDLLHWLRSHGITIASSCDGEGVCRKCVIQNEWLTCQMTLKDFLGLVKDKIVYIDYL